MMIRLAFSLLLLTAPLPLAAQQARELKVKPGNPYRHKPSRIEIPGTVLGARMQSARDLTQTESDISFQYEPEDGSDLYSIYVYRLAGASIPIWFDRARWSIEHRPEVYGTPVLTSDPLTFQGSGPGNKAGLVAAYRTEKNYRSTAVAMTGIDGWIIKVRYSSETATPEQARERTIQAIQSLRWPKPGKKDTPPAVLTPVQDCPSAIATAASTRSVKDDGTSAILGAVLSMAAADIKGKDKAEPAEPVTWCRDPKLGDDGVYRANAATNGYFLASSDSGRGLSVSPQMKLKDDAPDGWVVRFVDLERTYVLPMQDALPSPDRALAVLSEEKPVSSVSTVGKKKEITIDTGVLTE
ncbi:hypothetical protein ACNI3Q_12240 [Sphingomonas sp. FW199]|uniref:hypothetical protein n=1 Tax=Sphingomonas sp. FW199 TaxID=3400217 RepID=UPI003CEEB5E0